MSTPAELELSEDSIRAIFTLPAITFLADDDLDTFYVIEPIEHDEDAYPVAILTAVQFVSIYRFFHFRKVPHGNN